MGKKLTGEVGAKCATFSMLKQSSRPAKPYLSHVTVATPHSHTHTLELATFRSRIFGFWKSHTNAGQLDLVSLHSAASSLSIWFLVTCPAPAFSASYPFPFHLGKTCSQRENWQNTIRTFRTLRLDFRFASILVSPCLRFLIASEM